MPNPKRMNASDIFGQDVIQKSKSATPAGEQGKKIDAFEVFPKQAKPSEELSPLESGLVGAVDSASFGLADEGLAKALSLYDKYFQGKEDTEQERLSKLRMILNLAQRNPKSYLAGQILGSVGASIIPVLGPSRAAGFAGKVLRSGAGGGLYGFGSSEASLKDDPMKVAVDTGLGAIAGGVSQGLFSGAGALARPGLDKIAKQKAAEAAVKAGTGRNKAGYRQIVNQKPGGLHGISKQERDIGKVGRDVLEERTKTGEKLLKPTDDIEKLGHKFEEAKLKYGTNIGNTSKAIDRMYPDGIIDSKKIAKRIRNHADSLSDTNLGKATKKWLLEEADKIEKLGKAKFSKIHEIKQNYKQPQAMSNLHIDKSKGEEAINRYLREAMENAADDAYIAAQRNIKRMSKFDNKETLERAKDIINKYKENKSKYRSFKLMSGLSAERDLGNKSLNKVKPTSYLAAPVGASVGMKTAGVPGAFVGTAIAVFANQYLKKTGDAMAARSLHKISKLLDNKVLKSKYAKIYHKVLNSGAPAILSTHRALMDNDPLYKSLFNEED